MEMICKIEAVLLAICLIICGAIGYGMATGTFKGEKGDQGDIGLTGAVGPKGNDGTDGINGKDGKDAPVNHPPEVSLVTQSGNYVAYVPTIFNSCKYEYDIVVQVNDTDDEDFKVTFYYSIGTNISCSLEDHGVFYGGNGTYSKSVSENYNYIFRQPKTIYWFVEVWDGSDITVKTFNYTITP